MALYTRKIYPCIFLGMGGGKGGSVKICMSENGGRGETTNTLMIVLILLVFCLNSPNTLNAVVNIKKC